MIEKILLILQSCPKTPKTPNDRTITLQPDKQRNP
jgi:hypothetical protein